MKSDKIELIEQIGSRIRVQLNPGYCFSVDLPGGAGPLHYITFDDKEKALEAVEATRACDCDYCRTMPGLLKLAG